MKRLSSGFWGGPTEAVKANQVLTYFEVRQKLSPAPPGETSFCGMFRMVSFKCDVYLTGLWFNRHTAKGIRKTIID